MGVLIDFFAASGDELALFDPAGGPAGNDWPYVDCKGWEDGLLGLGGFVAELTGRDPAEFGEDVLVTDADAEHWLTRVPPQVTEAMAGVTDGRLAEHADDELLDEHDATRNVRLRDLARSALAGGRDLYCWLSL